MLQLFWDKIKFKHLSSIISTVWTCLNRQRVVPSDHEWELEEPLTETKNHAGKASAGGTQGVQ